jgi:hypothetical protein
MKTLLLTLLYLVSSMSIVSAQSEPSAKSQYHLFNPVPKELMREMSTDRPDKTESAYTVDAGHYQLETSFIDYAYDHRNPEGTDTRSDTLSVMPFNIKAGLLNNVDLQFVMDPYMREHTKEEGLVERKHGVGDIQTRLKVNFWGNDGGQTAFAAMPFVKFPTNSDDLGNGNVESGLILPLAVSLPAEWSMGIMAEFDWNRNEAGDYYTDYIHSITFSHQIIGKLNGYVEFFSQFNQEENSHWIGTIDAGLTYGLTDDIQFDLGLNTGISKAADDFNPFAGISIRY